MYNQFSRFRKKGGTVPFRYKVVCFVIEPIWQRRRVPVNNGSQLSKDIRVCLRWVRELAHRDLDEGETEGPDVGRDGVGHILVHGFPFDSFGLKID
jgi:hypothetical protein